MITVTQDNGISVATLDTLDDVLSVANPKLVVPNRYSTNNAIAAELAMASAHSVEWAGSTVEQAREALVHGWPEGVALVERMADSIREQVPQPQSYKRRQQWSEDGDEPSWEREQLGYQDVWRTSRRQQQRGPAIVRLAAPFGGHAEVEPSELRWDGVTLAVLIDVLERNGFRVHATINNPTTWGRCWHLTQIVVKEPHQPLDLSSMVPLIAFPGMFRWYGFMCKTLATFRVGSPSEMGTTMEIDNLPHKPSAIPTDAIVLRHTYSEPAARREITRVLRLLDPSVTV